MSEVKFTSGPLVKGSCGFENLVCNIYTEGESKFVLAVHADEVGTSEAEANADLFCAAPDLYEALQKILELPQDFSSPEVAFFETRRIAKAALAKAKGDTQ